MPVADRIGLGEGHPFSPNSAVGPEGIHPDLRAVPAQSSGVTVRIRIPIHENPAMAMPEPFDRGTEMRKKVLRVRPRALLQ